MINCVRSIRMQLQPQPLFSPYKGPSIVKFRLASTANNSEPHTNMDKAQNPTDKTGDVTSHSFGEGYATRSDDEGFGGIYGSSQVDAVKDDSKINESHPDYDKSQGSEVKEKEKGRHQTSVS